MTILINRLQLVDMFQFFDKHITEQKQIEKIECLNETGRFGQRPTQKAFVVQFYSVYDAANAFLKVHPVN